jgi:hypothetical protein
MNNDIYIERFYKKYDGIFKDVKSYNSCLFDEFVCKLGRFWHEGAILNAHECQKRPNLHTNELNTTFFCSTSPLKAPKPVKLV